MLAGKHGPGEQCARVLTVRLRRTRIAPVKTFLSSVVVFAMFAASRCFGAVLGFDSPSDITTYFNTVGSAKFSTVAGNGLSGSASGVTDHTFTNGALATISGVPRGATNPTFSISLYFRFATPTSTASGNCLMISLGAAAFDPNAGASSPDYASLSLQKTAFAATYTAQSSTNGFTVSTSVSLQNGGWYRLSIDTIWNTAGSRYDLLFSMNASDSSGTLGSLLYSRTTTGFDTDSGTGATPTIYGFIASSGPTADMGIAAFDNFSFPTVPEPSCIVLSLVGLAMLGMRRPWNNSN